MVDWGDPETLWLNVTNVALGLGTLTVLLVILYGVGAELAARFRKSARSTGEGSRDDYSPDLGLTVAEGADGRLKK